MTPNATDGKSLLRQLLPQFSIIAIMFTITGAGLATIPLFITNDLGLGATAVGISAGAQFITAIALRINAGRFCDRRGSAKAIRIGLLLTFLGSALCLLAWVFRGQPILAAGVLLFGRIALGGGESFVMSGTQTWALALAGTGRAAQVVGWVGSAMFSALALGAPLGGYFYQIAGFWSVATATALAALCMGVVCRGLRSASILPRVQPPLRNVIWSLRVEAGCMALSGFSYGSIISFSVILFIERNWVPSWVPLTVFSVALVTSRVLFGSFPDRIGGARAAGLSSVMLAVGMLTMALPGGVIFGLVGAAISGLGYALTYPAIKREAIQRAAPEARGTAMALVSASIYLSLGVGNPVMGVLADRAGTASVFVFAGAISAVASLILFASGRRVL